MDLPYILIIDDDITLLELLGSILRRNGFEIKQATDAEKGLAIINKQLPQLILLDIKIPGADGIETLKKLKEKERTKDIPVIMLTSENNLKSVSECLETGACDYIVKPFDPNNFVARIRTVINK